MSDTVYSSLSVLMSALEALRRHGVRDEDLELLASDPGRAAHTAAVILGFYPPDTALPLSDMLRYGRFDTVNGVIRASGSWAGSRVRGEFRIRPLPGIRSVGDVYDIAADIAAAEGLRPATVYEGAAFSKAGLDAGITIFDQTIDAGWNGTDMVLLAGSRPISGLGESFLPVMLGFGRHRQIGLRPSYTELSEDTLMLFVKEA